MPRLIALVGMCGSGKSVATDFFVAHGYTRIYFGGVTMDELARQHLPRNEENERRVREALRRDLGAAAFALKLLPKIEEALKTGDVIIDGLYSFSEYKVLIEKFPFLEVVAIVTNRALRYERLACRPVRPLSASDATSRDFAEIEHSEKGGPIAIADVFCINNGTETDLTTQLDALL